MCLPELGVATIKAKIDTGARTSALHAFDVEEVKHGRKTVVHFKIHPLQRNNHKIIEAKADLYDRRPVKDSGGQVTLRPVILTYMILGHFIKPIELTLVNRDTMGFRMLLGRQALRPNLLVNPGRSFVLKAIKKKKIQSL